MVPLGFTAQPLRDWLYQQRKLGGCRVWLKVTLRVAELMAPYVSVECGPTALGSVPGSVGVKEGTEF